MNYFGTTHWSIVLDAAHANPALAKAALEKLCQAYWYPLYAFARGQGDGHQDAQDATQGFFLHLVQSQLVAKAHPEHGRFRSYLLACFKNFRSKQYARSARIKRGGDTPMISFEELAAEERFAIEPSHDISPEERFDRNWAIRVLEQAHGLLQAEYAAASQPEVFARLQPWLSGNGAQTSYVDTAKELGKSEAALKMEVSRARARYRDLLREVVKQTVADPNDVNAELRYLFELLANS